MNRAGPLLLALVALVALAAPALAPNPPDRTFADSLYAPPSRVHIVHDGLRVRFIYPQRLISRLERRYEEDTRRPVALRWFTGGVW